MMTSRERVITTLEHKEPDRVPLCFGNHSVYTIIDDKPYGYRALCNYLNIRDYPEPVTNFVGNVLNVDKRIRDRLHVDFEFVSPGGPKDEILPNGHLRVPSLHGIIAVPTGRGKIYTIRDNATPLRWAKKPKDLDKYRYWSDYSDPVYYRDIKDKAKLLHEETDKAIIADDTPVTFGHMYSYLVGFDRWLTDMKLRPEFYHALMEKIYEKAEYFTKQFLTEVGDHIDLLLIWDDMGSQTGPLMSIGHFREFIAPYWKRWIDLARKYTKAKLVIHCCGSVYDLYPEFIKMGWDAHQTVQVTAKDMEPKKLKKEFGDKIAFFGGLDHQKVLPRETVFGVKKFVRKIIRELGAGGGYIFSPMHDLGPEIPPENIVTAFDEAYEFGVYPLVQNS